MLDQAPGGEALSPATPSAAPAATLPPTPTSDPSLSTAQGDSAAGVAPASAAPASPPAAPAYAPDVQRIQGEMLRLQAVEQAIQEQLVQDSRLGQYGEQLPDGLRAEIAQRQAAAPLAAQQIALQRQALELQQQRAQLELPARAVVEYQQHQAAQQALGPLYDQAELQRYLARYAQPDAMNVATSQYVELKRMAANATRHANGTDSMGGGGSPPVEDWTKLSASEHFARGMRG